MTSAWQRSTTTADAEVAANDRRPKASALAFAGKALRWDGVALSFAVALLLATGASAATTPTATQWKDTSYGYSITLPAKWYVIPRTTSAIKQEITYLKARKQSSLAGAYSAMLKSSASLSELKAYRFQAFLWPPLNSLVPTEVSVQI